jgi:hypothetical protein
MRSPRRLGATFTDLDVVREPGREGLDLGFRPDRPRGGEGRIEDFADLGPALTVPAVEGLGKVLRLLRAARRIPPRDPLALVGQAERAAGLLEPALGIAVVLEVRPRSRLRFTAWTDSGVETVRDVADVVEADDDYFVLRRDGRFPVRLPRHSVVRRSTELERWYEILDIRRA